jgi:two-component system, response regulator YesN
VIKLLVVEDVPRQRRAIINSVQWKEINIEIIGEAENGVEALSYIESFKPDIVLTDIEMPRMGGIEFAQRLKDIYPDIKVIFLTSHSDFEYARRAINLDVYNYISKPVNCEELLGVMESAAELCLREKDKLMQEQKLKSQLEESLPALREKFFRELIFGVYTREDDAWSKIKFLNLSLSKGAYCVAIFEIDDFEMVTDNMTEENRQIVILQMINAVKESFINNKSCVFIDILGPKFVILLQLDTNAELDEKEGIYNYFNAIHSTVREQLKYNISLGISKISSEISSVPRLYNQAKKALKAKFSLGKSSMIMYEDFNYNEDIQLKVDAIHSNLKAVLNSGDKTQIDKFIDDVFSNVEGNKFISQTVIQNLCFAIINYSELALIEMNDNFDNVFAKGRFSWQKVTQFETVTHLKLWIKDVLYKVCEYISGKNNTKNKKIIDHIKMLISTKYFEELTVQDIAGEVYLSPNYVNLIFKSDTGFTIPDYITQYRISKAKALLEDQEIKVYEVGEMVGYKNKSHFTQLFKQITGMTPNEFRKKV